MVTQYNSLEFRNFVRIGFLKMRSFWCQKIPLCFSISVLLESLYLEEPGDDFLNLFLLLVCSYDLGIVGANTYHVYIKNC